jgi:hypothetical protein
MADVFLIALLLIVIMKVGLDLMEDDDFNLED